MTYQDNFVDGKGIFQIKLLWLFTISYTKDKEIDNILRYLAEAHIPYYSLMNY
ncbi:MAG: hypothetical protein ACTHKC_10795 [Candidatus Nitrosocosmicus sp.]